MHPLIKKLAKKAKRTEVFVESLWNSIEESLIKEGLDKTDKRFYSNVINSVKSKLEINESSLIIKRFKDFLKEKNET